MIYIVDIDETICTTPYIGGENRYDLSEPFMDRIEKINNLHDMNHIIIYWTARGGSTGKDWAEFTHAQLLSWGCKFSELKMNKPMYDVWIDDKALHSLDYFK